LPWNLRLEKLEPGNWWNNRWTVDFGLLKSQIFLQEIKLGFW
jgi:hypothetical protein